MASHKRQTYQTTAKNLCTICVWLERWMQIHLKENISVIKQNMFLAATLVGKKEEIVLFCFPFDFLGLPKIGPNHYT